MFTKSVKQTSHLLSYKKILLVKNSLLDMLNICFKCLQDLSVEQQKKFQLFASQEDSGYSTQFRNFTAFVEMVYDVAYYCQNLYLTSFLILKNIFRQYNYFDINFQQPQDTLIFQQMNANSTQNYQYSIYLPRSFCFAQIALQFIRIERYRWSDTPCENIIDIKSKKIKLYMMNNVAIGGGIPLFFQLFVLEQMLPHIYQKWFHQE
ncbi:unnamed protein product [Paramecium sonneborni]|uniref:Transmembrane protein n=1 Tax=Paramecium sonneborni TaxID=65129 RepID=A0A8S1MA46_9CILI|nr:unnamed protein product [Paramecium sonneborni]